MSSLIVLASASPRRSALLDQIGVKHQVLPVDIDESPLPNEEPHDMVIRLARAKALAAEGLLNEQGKSGMPILAADTVVVHNNKALGKPVDKSHHLSMLTDLSDTTHQVITAFSLKSVNADYTEAVTSEVTFMHLSTADITDYWQTGEPQDKAGGYGIQGYAATFVKHLSGSYTGVVGLPLYELACALRRFGVQV